MQLGSNWKCLAVNETPFDWRDFESHVVHMPPSCWQMHDVSFKMQMKTVTVTLPASWRASPPWQIKHELMTITKRTSSLGRGDRGGGREQASPHLQRFFA